MTTNEEFNALREKNGIGITQAGVMMDASINTAKCWAADPSAVKFRRMPNYALKCFKLALEKRLRTAEE